MLDVAPLAGAWIEISLSNDSYYFTVGRPPRGGRGLK